MGLKLHGLRNRPTEKPHLPHCPSLPLPLPPSLGGEVPCLELLEEALVGGPEEADVRDVKQHHGQPLQAQAVGGQKSGARLG